MSYTVRPIKGHNPWLTRRLSNRNGLIVGVMIHSTRSGSRSAEYDDMHGTENWANSPSNGSRAQGWGSYWDELIGRNTGERIICTDWDNEYATWTAGYGDSGTWAAGIYYIQIEVCQARIDQPFTDVQIDSLAQSVAEKSHKYNFPIERIPFLHQTGPRPRGICTHEDSANGVKLGKSDPGPLFPWDRFLTLAKGYKVGDIPQEVDVTPEEVKEIVNKQTAKDRDLALQCAYAIAGIPRPYEGDAVGEALEKMKPIAAREAPLWDAVQKQNAVLHDVLGTLEQMEPGLGLNDMERQQVADAIDALAAVVRGDGEGNPR